MSLKLPHGFSFFRGGGWFGDKKNNFSKKTVYSPSFKLRTDKEAYRPGDEITATIEISNPGISNEANEVEPSRDEVFSLLLDNLTIEIKGVEKLDSQWFSVQNPLPASKQKRGETVFLDCTAPTTVSKVVVSCGRTKTYMFRAQLPMLLPPSYRGTSIRYFYYIRSTISGRWLVLENGHHDRPGNDLIKMEARAPLQVWATQKTNNFLNDEGNLNRGSLRPKRSPPPPPIGKKVNNVLPQPHEELKTRTHGFPTVENGLGAFWSTQFAHDSQAVEGKGISFEEEPVRRTSKHNHIDLVRRTSPSKEQGSRTSQASNYKGIEDGQTENLGTRFSPENNTSTFQNQSFNPNKPNSGKNLISKRERELETEVEMLKEQLKQVNLEKAEITSKFEKLSVICRSQRQEIQDLKLSHATSTPPSSKEKSEGSVSDPQQAMLSFNTSSDPDPKPWKAFADEPKRQLMTNTKHSKSVRTNNNLLNSTEQTGSSSAVDNWGFHHLTFAASSPSRPDTFRSPTIGSSSQRFATADVKKVESSPPGGWAGF